MTVRAESRDSTLSSELTPWGRPGAAGLLSTELLRYSNQKHTRPPIGAFALIQSTLCVLFLAKGADFHDSLLATFWPPRILVILSYFLHSSDRLPRARWRVTLAILILETNWETEVRSALTAGARYASRRPPSGSWRVFQRPATPVAAASAAISNRHNRD